MLLHTVTIKNYKSLEDVTIDDLGRLNIFIGRNNAGKSSVFGALDQLNSVLSNTDGNFDYTSVLTAKNSQRRLEINLMMVPQPDDRKYLFKLLDIDQDSSRYENLFKSLFFTQIEYVFCSFGLEREQILCLNKVRILDVHGRWAEIFGQDSKQPVNAKSYRSTQLEEISHDQHHPELVVENIDIKFAGVRYHTLLLPIARTEPYITGADSAISWIAGFPRQYLQSAFFFSPFRHSTGKGPSQSSKRLLQDGSNLAQALFTLRLNEDRKFEKIRAFIQSVIPDIGMLETNINDRHEVEISFRAKDDSYSVKLPDMGGGVSQLLMVAVVLVADTTSSAIFIEEPESHLHTGAQRALLDSLYGSNSQIFISTHSSTFVNSARAENRIYRVVRSGDASEISAVIDAMSLSNVLDDIGVRNSDVLMSDAILFVEGRSDKQVLIIFSEKINLSLLENNITILDMGGGSHAERHAPIRSSLLDEISHKASVPHIFVLDRDHRKQNDIDYLEKRLQGRVHILKGRELENYLLVPHALLAALRSKCSTDKKVLQQVDRTSIQEIDNLIQQSADALYLHVLVKRIGMELGGLPGGFLTREHINTIIGQVSQKDLQRKISSAVNQHISSHLSKEKIVETVREQKVKLQQDWADTHRRRMIAPGAEIIDSIFRYFGQRYNKTKDLEHIARAMKSSDIADELIDLIQRVNVMAQRTT